MGIFLPSKDGDCMGKQAYQRMNKHQRREFGQQKRMEEERRQNGDHYKTQRESKKFQDKIDQGLNELRKSLAVERRQK
jgi:hypothetical protein